MGTSKRKHKSLLLSAGRRKDAVPTSNTRPVHSKAAPNSLSSKVGRDLIRKIHVLQKRRVQALQSGDMATAAEMEKLIAQAGGLERYQQASLNGQSRNRGGDSSQILLSWFPLPKTKPADFERLRVLEIGALSPDNAISQSPCLEVTRIDLNSTHPAIEEQDFMQRPLPTSKSQRFHLISCSLVLNFVPTPEDRGKMLRRLSEFLVTPPAESSSKPTDQVWPCVFIVLPAPCLLNSRYLDREQFEKMMRGLGYTHLQEKVSAKLIYQLWRWEGKEAYRHETWKKEEVNPGKGRNNFAIVLK